jgi:predicted glycoside hydrolase/deacetylase ChbG (UPF0249 family)
MATINDGGWLMVRTIGMIALVGTAVALFSVRGHAQTLAEKLGYSADDKLLIVHADDAGMCHSVNMATVDALKNGTVTCGSIMVPCPWFPEIAAYCREHPEADLGLHLTLTAEWQHYRWAPLAPHPHVPGLLDKQGFMWHEETQTAQHATAEEVEKELRAQIDRALQFGVKPTHLDSHMGTVFTRPDYFTVYLKLAEEYNIPPLVVEYREELAAHLGPGMAEAFRAMVDLVKGKGFPALDRIIPDVGGTFETKKEHYERALRNLEPGVTEIIVHLGYADNELKAITNSARMRQLDYDVFTAPSTRKLIDELGIKLIGWKELKELRDRERR